ncbi:hypothetical protein Tco_0058125 [Tanacetum coccineum]
MPGCSWRGHLRGVHIHYCPGVLGGDTCEGYIFITARVFLEGTPVMGTYGFHYCPGVLGGDTYDGHDGFILLIVRILTGRVTDSAPMADKLFDATALFVAAINGVRRYDGWVPMVN